MKLLICEWYLYPLLYIHIYWFRPSLRLCSLCAHIYIHYQWDPKLRSKSTHPSPLSRSGHDCSEFLWERPLLFSATKQALTCLCWFIGLRLCTLYLYVVSIAASHNAHTYEQQTPSFPWCQVFPFYNCDCGHLDDSVCCDIQLFNFSSCLPVRATYLGRCKAGGYLPLHKQCVVGGAYKK